MAHSYRFGQVEVRPSERRLLVEGRPAAVGARAFDVLLALIDARDRVVTKDELLEKVWPGLVVEENNLQVQVSTLRKILGAQAVATVPGRGYRFTLVPEDAPSCSLPRRHNLPAALTSFVGRESEIGEIREMLAASRLVTLTSTGGTGKTRLALQVAADLAAEFADGVWLVDLAPITDPDRVAQVVAFVLDVQEDPKRPMIDSLADYVRERQVLIVLDNCEHLVRDCAAVAKRLLVAGPGVKIIATSRERLGITGEVNYPLPALGVPQAGVRLSPEELARSESVQLFMDRASAALPSFRLTDANARFVAEICSRLDGIPLAIELAAARVASLGAEGIATQLGKSLRVLTDGDVTALPRQRTLRASIDWSHELLELPERTLFRRLAVFAGGWTIESAETVGAGGDVRPDDVADLLAHLVQKSLVLHDAAAGRYRLLETIRQYAQELLNASGEADAVRTRHLHYYLALAERARPGLTGPDQGAWLAKIDTERENLVSAHVWCEHAPDGGELGLRGVIAIKHYWFNRGLTGAGYRTTIEALSRPGARQPNELRCRALFAAGQFAYFSGLYADARQSLEESLAIARAIGEDARVADALQPLGLACLAEGDFGTARRHLEDALALIRKLGDKRNTAAALVALAQLHRAQGDLGAAEPLYEGALKLAREVGDHETIAVVLLNLTMTWVGRGVRDRAAKALLEALEIVDRIGSRRTGQSVLEVAAGLAAAHEQWDLAAQLYGTAQAQQAVNNLRRSAPDEAFLEPRVGETRAALGESAFLAAEERGRASSYDATIDQARAWLEELASR